MSNLLRNIALVTEGTNAISPSDLTRVAAALQKQATRDFGPVWGVTATVDAFTRLEDVPIGYWPIIVGDVCPGGLGVHLDDQNQPYALVEVTSDWTVTASHEALEMLADPFGNRLVAGDSPDSSKPGRVEFLLEVCDPCEAPTLGYTVNGVRVSDFYHPRFFEPPQQAGNAAARYDFMGHIEAPRQVLPGGYLSWRTGTGEWSQETFFSGSEPEFVSIGFFDQSHGSLRAWIDTLSKPARLEAQKAQPGYPNQVLVRLAGDHHADANLADNASKERAERLRGIIHKMCQDQP
ncbi:MAG TPA: hypothetical protein VFE05_12690 [Longimicrobiaceae bacterium]|jgi:hypothetical protein|nr:hypothetical protein [Longimicrobiaceae bacterium]